jgi:serine/threonine-protein kinase
MSAEADRDDTLPAAEAGDSEPAARAESGLPCPACRKQNHPSVIACVFCGLEISHPSLRVRRSWVEGPESGEQRVAGDRHGVESDYESMAVPIADPLIGIVVAERYRILEGLGRGGMGIVYRVEHTRLGKLLAMKLLTGELSRNREVVRRFKHEALTVSKLSSPNTVQVFDFGTSDGLTYLVMELVAGHDLARVLRAEGPMPFSRLGRIIVQVCNSLAEAHGMGIVHRDMKPENVMLVRADAAVDVAKVLDFGLAKIREGSDLNELTSQGAIVGTPYYMSPEQVRGDPVDPRSDIYSLGVLMYRALTGHYPFHGATPMAVFTKHLTEQPIAPSERAPAFGIPPAVSTIVLKALEKEPERRWQNIDELKEALLGEMRELGTSSLERMLHPPKPPRVSIAPGGDAALTLEIATRNEVEAYERKLRRQRVGAIAFSGLLVVSGLGVGVKLFLGSRVETFTGAEVEPNNAARDATVVPLGQPATGLIGRRIDAERSDRDFFAVDIPKDPSSNETCVTLSVKALPNFALCSLLYRQGFETPLAQYCVGRPGRDLVIPALRIEPGRYFLAILQDMSPYGAPVAPPVHENVSDRYELLLAQASADPSWEVEPNDQVGSANPIRQGAPITGTLGWASDVDIYCAAAGASGKIQWTVRDELRDLGAVLEVAPIMDSHEKPPMRVHGGEFAGVPLVTQNAPPEATERDKLNKRASSTKKRKAARTAAGRMDALHAEPAVTDAKSPWKSVPIAAEPGALHCIRLRLVVDPWAKEATSPVPRGGSEKYVVALDPAP